MKARARVIGDFIRFGNRRDRNDAAASGEVKGTGAPKAKLLLGSFAALAVTLVLGVALAGAVAPVVTVENADEVEYTTAHVEGTVNPEGHETSFHFEYITDDQYLANEGNAEPLFQGATEVGNGSTEVTFSPAENLSGLAPATEYHLRLVASNDEGETAEDVAASTFTTKAVAKPLVSGLATTETHFSGMVNPNAPEAAPATDAVKAGFNTHWSFTCNPGCSFTGPSEGDLEADNSATEVSADPVNLTPNQPYDVTLHATNAGGEKTETLIGAFTTPGLVPAIGDAILHEPTATSIVLAGTVNPHNSPLSDCHFAYGQAGSFDLSAPCESLPGGGEGVSEVRAAIEDLSPGTEYDFRLIATNGIGTGEGAIRHFQTFAEPSTEAACPNEAIRVAQHATALGDCRAWERVSPAEKGDGDIIGEALAIKASDSGDAAAFESRLGFGDAVGSGTVGRITYLARRGPGGWATHSITPMPRPDAAQIFFASTRVEAFADDLSNALVWAYDLPAVSDDTPLRENMYLEDTTTGALRTISKSLEEQFGNSEFTSTHFAGYSADAKHFAFATSTRMLPGMPPSSGRILYKWDDGVLSVAGTLPNGDLPPGGVKRTPQTLGGAPEANIKGAMSADGSRLVFAASPAVGAPDQLYLHVDGRPSVWVSEPEMSDENDKTPRNGIIFEGMTPDGNNVFFVSAEPLVDGDPPGTDMYRFTYSADPAGDPGNLTLIDDEAMNIPTLGGTLIGMSDDASRVYLHEASEGLKLWQEGVPGLTTIEPSAARYAGKNNWLTLLTWGPGNGRVSPDGNWLAYIRDGQMYLYDRAGESLACVSCPSDASIEPTVTNSGRRYYTGFRPHFLSDGGQVFFTSTGSLLPTDTNGVADVYSYDGPTGKLSLLTSGRGSEPMMFADASPSGDDVFFVTRQQLALSDRDEYVDLYDARAEGGFDEPVAAPSAPCAGEACQGAGALAPGVPPAASSTLRGAGNVKSGRCGPNRRKVTRNGATRCVKKKHRKHKRTANHNRRAGR